MLKFDKKKLVVIIYSHPEKYPPTLNAIEILSHHFEKIEVICSNFLESHWQYPSNVKLTSVGSLKKTRNLEKRPMISKFIHWFRFTNTIKKAQADSQVILAYDPIAIFSYFILSSFFKTKSTKIIWYHNHDVVESSKIRKYSITWWAVKLQKRIFERLSIFSLPSMERIVYFPMGHFNGKFFFIPNYPSKGFFEPFQHQNEAAEIKIVFQGMIDKGHGFEEVISLLPQKVKQRPLKLILYGPVSKKYKKELEALVEKKGVSNEVSFYDFIPYQDVPDFSRKCHIGMAIFTKDDIMNSTRATASNKIYEYAALGLPVLYYDNAHYRKHLGQYNWAIPTDLSDTSLLKAFNYIMDNYAELSASARQSFLKESNYEKQFEKVVTYLNSINE